MSTVSFVSVFWSLPLNDCTYSVSLIFNYLPANVLHVSRLSQEQRSALLGCARSISGMVSYNHTKMNWGVYKRLHWRNFRNGMCAYFETWSPNVVSKICLCELRHFPFSIQLCFLSFISRRPFKSGLVFHFPLCHCNKSKPTHTTLPFLLLSFPLPILLTPRRGQSWKVDKTNNKR